MRMPPWLEQLISRFAAGVLRPVLVLLGRAWRPVLDLWDVLVPTRVSALTLLAGGFLLSTAQGQELAVRLKPVEGASTTAAFLLFLAAVTLFALQAWYWARIALEFDSGMGHRARSWRHTWIPRIYAGLAFGFATLSHLLVGDLPHAAVTLATGAAVFGLLVLRLPLADRLGMTEPASRRAGQSVERFRDLPAASQAVLCVSVAASLVMFVVILFWPVTVGQWLGGAAVAFLAFSQIVPVATLAVIPLRDSRVPLILTAFLLALAFSFWNDNHEVPLAGLPDTAFHDQRPGVAEAARAWAERTATPAPGVARTVVFLSTAGGGLRAAYWTATVMGTLEDSCPAFRDHLFSVSGVSGGSVGAALFSAMGRAGEGAATACGSLVEGGPRATLLQKALSADFLGPVAAAMLYPDLVQRFLPWPMLPDRGAALEAGWNASWIKACSDAGSAFCDPATGDLASPFLAVAGLPGKGQGWRPLLLLNATHQETGKRLVAGNVRVVPPAFLDAFDLHDVLKADVSLGTAALNSARFTYVSPAGLLKDADGTRHGHVLDGGYFENFGAVTSAEVAREALRVLEAGNVPVRPVFIQISSDPDLSDADLTSKAPLVWPPGGKPAGRPFANEIAGPVRGLMHTREARGLLATKTLEDILARHEEEPWRFPSVVEPLYVHLRLCGDGKVKPPLGWVMSVASEREIAELDRASACDAANVRALETVIGALANPVAVTCEPLPHAGPLYCRAGGTGN